MAPSSQPVPAQVFKSLIPVDRQPVAVVGGNYELAEPLLLEFQSPSAALIQRPVPFVSRFVTWIITSLFVALVAIAWLMPIDRVVTTNGKVVSTAPHVVVQPLETAIVRSIEVHEGQVVNAGDLLARFDPTFAEADAGSLEKEVASLQAEVDRLKAELANQEYLSDGSVAGNLQAMNFLQRRSERTSRLKDYQEKINSAKSKIQQEQSNIALFSERLSVAQVIEDKRRTLERLQVGSQLNTLAAQDVRVERVRGLENAKRSLESAQSDHNALNAERDAYTHQFQAQTSQQLTEQGRKLASARENLNKAKLRRTLVELRADQAAIVLNVAPVSVGAVLQSGEQLFTLVPVNSPLEVETLANARDAGFVQVGQPVTIKFETFPYFTYGVATGTVRSISPDSFRRPMDDRERATRPHTEQETGTLYYRTRISLGEVKLHNLPPGFQLTPGMPVTADVKIGERTVMQFLLSRVMPATSEGMREP